MRELRVDPIQRVFSNPVTYFIRALRSFLQSVQFLDIRSVWLAGDKYLKGRQGEESRGCFNCSLLDSIELMIQSFATRRSNRSSSGEQPKLLGLCQSEHSSDWVLPNSKRFWSETNVIQKSGLMT